METIVQSFVVPGGVRAVVTEDDQRISPVFTTRGECYLWLGNGNTSVPTYMVDPFTAEIWTGGDER